MTGSVQADGRPRPTVALPSALPVTVAAVTVVSLVAGMFASPPDALFVAGWVLYPTVGAAILMQLPGNAVGTAMLGVGIGFGLASVGLWLPPLLRPEAHGWVALATGPGFGIAVASLVLMLALFPDGSPDTPRQRWLVRAAGVLALFQLLGGALDPIATADVAASPLGVSQLGEWPARIENGALLVGLVVMILALADLVWRSRRSTAARRLQFRWFMAAASVAIAFTTVSTFSPVWGPLLVISLSAPPVAIGIAVTRHGLYGIDRLISRSVTYLVLTAAVVLTYAMVVTSVTRIVPTSSSAAVAAATLAAVAVFRPLLVRIQGWVDRRFDRARYDALCTADQLAEKLRVAVEPNEAVDALVVAVQRTLQPTSVAVWTRRD